MGDKNLSYPSESRRRALTAINLLTAIFFVVNRILRAVSDPSREPLLTTFEYSIFTVVFVVVYIMMRFKYFRLLKYVSLLSIYSFIILVIYLSPEQFYGFLFMIPMSLSFMMLSNKENAVLSLVSAIYVLSLVRDRGSYDGYMTQVILLIGILSIFIIQKRLQSNIQQHNMDQLEKKNQQVIRSNKMEMINKISTGVMHDLANYQFIVANHVSFLFAKVDQNSDIYDDLCTIKDIMGKSTFLLRQMRSPAEEEINQFSLNTVFEEIKRFLKPIISENVEFQVDIEDVEITGIESQLLQVLMNLLSNSLDSMGDTGKLILEAKVKENSVCIRVIDNGKGIKVDELDNIFEPFFTTKKHGTGIGLVISKEIIENSFNGTISVESTPDEKTEFLITIPYISE